MTGMRRRLLGVLVLVGTLFHGATMAAPPPQWRESGVFAYNANKVPVQKVLDDFAKNFNATMIMSSPPQGFVTGRIQGATPEEFLDRLALSYQFTWFFYNNRLYIAPIHDRMTERIRVGDMTTSDVKQALQGVGLFEAKFGWGELQDDSTVLVSGPREYVKLVKEAVTAENGGGLGASDETMIFRLRYAFLEDRKISFRDKTITVPGLLSVLRNLMRDGRGNTVSDSDTNARAAKSQVPGSDNVPGFVNGSKAPREAFPTEKKASSKDGPIIEGDVRTNSIIIRGDTSKREYYRSLISQLDQPQQMVEIEALIIDIQKSKLKELGIDWAATFGGGSGRTTVSNNNIIGLPARDASTLTINNLPRFLAQIRALEGEGTASIIGKPAVMTMENIGAVIDLSRTVYLRLVGERVADVQTVTVGTMMKVTPKVVRDGGGSQVQLFIDIEDGTLLNEQSTVTPVVERSVVATQMIVDDQQSLVIGGYNVQSSVAGRNAVPGVSKVPGVGGFFRSNSEVEQGRERIFVITPRLIDNKRAQTRARYISESVDRPRSTEAERPKYDSGERPKYDSGENTVQRPTAVKVETSMKMDLGAN
jgi:type III secretion protein C